MYDILKTINSPADVKALSQEQLTSLASDVREALFNRLTKIGGHFGPNFGTVEAEIALHYVFNSPTDKFVFDVSHQCYTHKMLTGRREGYIDEEHFREDSGYTNPSESPHDFFNVGHTSTSIALALGLAKGRDLQGGKENIIAFIGDGSLSGGEAMEALNIAGAELGSNLIIVVNDNEQAIAETHGGIYKNLKALRDSNGTASPNWFRAFGLDYVYVPGGNDIPSLIKAFQCVKDIDHPIVVHIHTQKGKGYRPAEEHREAWHWCVPFDRATSLPTVPMPQGESYLSIARDYIMEKAASDPSFVVVTPAMPGSIGLSIPQRERLGKQYLDTGIAEELAVASASGIARRGGKPLVVTNLTFLQRAYDQISQDVCINGNPVTMLMNYSAFDSLTDVTHLGIFSLAAFSNIPGLVVLSPTCAEEFRSMLEQSVDQSEHPTLILIPGGALIHRAADCDFSVVNRFKVEVAGSRVAILALGDFFPRGQALAAELEKHYGIKPTLVNPRYASGLDEELLDSLLANHSLTVTLEDGILDGGFGQKVASYYGPTGMKVKNFALRKQFYDRYNPAELLHSLGMETSQMAATVAGLL